MTKEIEISERVARALEEVKLIREGKIPRRSAREMLKQTRERLDDEK